MGGRRRNKIRMGVVGGIQLEWGGVVGGIKLEWGVVGGIHNILVII